MIVTKYKIVRYYQAGWSETVKRGLSLETAQIICNDPEGDSNTCQGTAGLERTAEHGAWFEGYTAE